MVNENLLKEVIKNQKDVFLGKTDLFKRDLAGEIVQKYVKLDAIIAITGLRRVGKSSLMRLIWDEVKGKEKLSDEQFLYLNFEDERLIDFSKDDFAKALQIFYETNSPDKTKKIFLFLDEIQIIKYWEKWARRLYEEKKFKIFITGSNATLLSSELATALTGRNIPIALHPLSFYEFYVYFQNNAFSKNSLYDIEERAKIKKSFGRYFQLGGMPEYIRTESAELIQEYFKDIILRDIVNRYNVKYKQGLKELAHFLLAAPGQISSLRNISRSIEIKNINTVKNYLQYLQDSFLFYKVPLFSYSYKRQIYNPDKVYVADLAFFHNIAFQATKNLGALYENLVFLTLLRKDKEIFYYKTVNNLEADFVVREKNKITDIIQVSFSLKNKQIRQREISSLISAMNELKLKKGWILVNDEEEAEIKQDGKIIIIKPIYKWLLER